MLSASQSGVELTVKVVGLDQLRKQLKAVGAKAKKVVRKELRVTTKQTVAIVRPMIPVGDTNFLQRSLTVRSVKSKKRYDIAFRIIGRYTKGDKFYLFAPNYGVADGLPGHQQGHHFLERGIKQAEGLLGDTVKRISQGITQLT